MILRRVLPIVLLLSLAAGAGVWLTLHRRVDGRDGTAWLAYAAQAAKTVSYHAEGRALTNGAVTTFALDQGSAGCYCMTVIDAAGKRCMLGSDGTRAWYRTGAKTESAAIEAPNTTLVPRGRVTGVVIVAGRPAVWVSTSGGSLTKRIAIDRETGVILSMLTFAGGKLVGETTCERIVYREVAPGLCQAPDAHPKLHAATLHTLTALLGRTPLQPAYLPRGFSAIGTYRDRCACCSADLAVLRYGDGVAGLTLFEMKGTMACGMTDGCRMAPTAGALVDSRVIHGISVSAVGNISQEELRRVLESLR